MLNDALEYLAAKYGNVVIYDDAGKPSVFVPFQKCLSSDLDSSLPSHVHPAFIVNGVEQDRVLIGKYMACELEANGTLYSIPGKPPRINLGMDPFLTRMQAFRDGASGMTIADHGLILLTAKKYGWVPKGNNNYGADYRDGTKYEFDKVLAVDDVRVYRGWKYKCLVAHTTSAEHLPENDRAYWEKLDQVGGTPVLSQAAAGNWYQGYNTLTGSGPLSWCLGNDPGNLVDIQGNAAEQVYGYRTVDGEIQILANNDAADPTKDLGVDSAAWKAILPSTTDDTYTLVAPGTSGALHWNWLNSKVTLDTTSIEDNTSRSTAFKDLAVNSANVPYIPSIMRELGLFPCTGDTTQGTFYVNLSGERVARRGGNYNNASNAGLGYLHGNGTRSNTSPSFGARPRSL